MAATTSSITVPVAVGTAKLKTQNDVAAGTNNPVHPIVDTNGAVIDPATSGNQAAANTVLAAIQESVAKIPDGGATATKQDTGNAALAAISANTAAGAVNLALTPTVTVGAYTPGMVVGGKLSFAGAARSNGGSGEVRHAYVSKAAGQSALFQLYVFHTDPASSTFTDHAALAIDPADMDKLAGVIPCEDVIDCGTPALVQAAQQGLPFKIAAANTTLFVVPVISGSETYAATNAVKIGLGIAQN